MTNDDRERRERLIPHQRELEQASLAYQREQQQIKEHLERLLEGKKKDDENA